MSQTKKVFSSGVVLGIVAVVLTKLGNPANMGLCIACFLRDMAGALGLHRTETVQYIRPEIIGLILGSFIIAVARKEFRPRGGSSPMTRFVIAVIVMFGALVFLGCPTRMVLRIAGGDLNAVVGLAGFIVGAMVGVVFLKRGYTLKRTYALSTLEGAWPALSMAVLLVLAVGGTGLFFVSQSGPGSMHAPVLAAFFCALLVGIVAQRSRLCTVGGFRDVMLFRDFTLLFGFLGILIAAGIGNFVTNQFHLSMLAQPIAHVDSLWNFLGMVLVGFGSVLLGGCPFRQLILAGEGNADSAITIVGYIAGGALAHNFALASAPSVIKDGVLTGGVTPLGKQAVLMGLVLLIIIAQMNTEKRK